MTRCFFVALLLGMTVALTAQETAGQLTLNQPYHIETMVKRHSQFLKDVGTVPGYRIQIVSSPRLQQAESVRARYVERNLSYPDYLEFTAPNYRLRIGDFQSRIEALQHLQEIQRHFPAAFIVRERVKLVD